MKQPPKPQKPLTPFQINEAKHSLAMWPSRPLDKRVQRLVERYKEALWKKEL